MAVKKIPGREQPTESVKTNTGRHDEFGRELLDGRPMQPPLGYKRTPSLAEQISAMVRNERIQAELRAAGVETFAEADDFNIPDDVDPTSPYEMYFEPTPLAELVKREKADKAAKKKAAEEAAQAARGGQEPAKPAGAPPEGGSAQGAGGGA